MLYNNSILYSNEYFFYEHNIPLNLTKNQFNDIMNKFKI